MKIKISFFAYLFLLLSFLPASAQLGKDGSKSVSASNQVYNEYTALTANAIAGATTIQVASSSLNSNGRFTAGLSAGDLIFIIQVQGAAIDGGSYWWNFGYVSNYVNCGNNELAQVIAVPNATSITLSCPLAKNYTATGKVQVVRVPRLTTLTVNSGGSITCDAWNGTIGGVVALEVSGITTVNAGGEIHANGKGFRGGVNSDMVTTTGGIMVASTDNTQGAEKGEGVAGAWSDYDLIGGRYCKNAPANGGGGGNAHNGGGGGGANTYSLGWSNGNGNPDTSTATWKAAWDLESANFHHNTSDGGGRGGYTFSWNNMDATAVGPDNASWGGDNRRNQGGMGGRPLIYSDGRLFLGGGGGAGDQGEGTDWGGDGGNGGGLIYMRTFSPVNGAGLISSDGNLGTDSQGSASWNSHAGIDAGGGGGAGGTIVIESAGNIASGMTLRANGGKGGDQHKIYAFPATANAETEGPGGGGGGGMIQIVSGTPARIALGGVNGISDAANVSDCGVTEFPPNGATKGGKGKTDWILSTFTFAVPNDTICTGENGVLTATYTGSVPAGTTMQWYDAAVGGTLLGTGNTLTMSGITSTTTVYAGTCPGTYRIPTQIVLIPFVFDAGSDLHLCSGVSATLLATGGNSYSWTPAGSVSNAGIANPTVTLTATTEFFAHITNASGCSGTDSVTVYINTVTAQSNPDTAICYGSALNLQASGGTSYHWNTGDTTALIHVTPASSQNYTVIVTSAACSDTATTAVTVNAVPVVSLGSDTTLCAGMSIALDAGNAGSSYHWQDNTALQLLTAAVDGDYSVTVTTGQGCSDADSIHVTVLPLADAHITATPPLCLSVGVVTLTAASSGGTWSGDGITSATAGTFDPPSAGVGSALVIYSIPGICGDIDSATITVYPVPAVFLGPDTTLCEGMILTLNAGNAGSLYHWQDSTTLEDYSVSIDGFYSVTVTNSDGCSDSDSIQVTFLPLSNATITAVSPLCANGGVITLQAADNGGVWSGNGITSPTTGTFDPAIAGIGSTQVNYLIPGTCGDGDSVMIMVNPGPVVGLGPDTTLCVGMTLNLDAGNAGSTYQWQDNSALQILNVSNSGTYSVTVTNTFTCSSTDDIIVAVLPVSNALITAVAPLCANAGAIVLDAADNGGIWSGDGITNSTSGAFDPAVAGSGPAQITYSIPGYCGDSDQLTIVVYSVPLLTTEAGFEPCADTNAGWVALSITEGLPPYSIVWSNAATTEDLAMLTVGNYSVTVTDSNGCSATSQENIEMPVVDCYVAHLYVPNVFSPNGDGINDIFLVRGAGIKSFELIIYNRWGEKVFQTTDSSQGWDGIFRDQGCDAGVYYFVLKVTLSDGQEIKKGGNITLVK